MSDTIASWGGLEIQLVSPDIVDGINSVKTFMELINTALDIALNVAEIAKAFVTSNLDLARALVNQIIAMLRAIIQDLFSLGVYANLGDLTILSRGKAGLKGGYSAYQRRMLTRLNDRTDPNRPDFSTSSTVLALFFYVGVDVSFVDGILDTTKFQPLLQFLRSFGALFGFTVGGSNLSLPIATNLRAEYSSPTNLTSPDPSIAWSSLVGRSKMKILWNVAPAPGGSDQDPNPPIPPSGFIVEVSCYPRGFQVGWIAPATSGTGGPNGTGSATLQSFATGQYQMANTGTPLVIFGGEDSINLTPEVSWPSNYSPGDPLIPGAHPAYFFRDPSTPEVIRKPFGKSADGRTYYNQRSFFVPKDFILSQVLLGGTYSLELKLEDLPLYCPINNGVIDTAHAVKPSTVYVRVIPVTNRVVETNYKQARWTPKNRVSDDQDFVSIFPVPVPRDEPLGDSDLGTPSQVLEMAIPNEDHALYSQAVQTALAIIALSRSDLTTPDPVNTNEPVTPDATYLATGLEGISTEVLQWLRIANAEEYFCRRHISPQSFIGDLYPRIISQSDRYIQTQGALPPAALRAMEGTFRTLVNWKWSDTQVAIASGNPSLNYTILQSLFSTNGAVTPLSINRYGTRRYCNAETPTELLQETATNWREGTFGISYHPASIDSSPLVGPTNTSAPHYWYARNLIPQEIYDASRAVLALTTDQSTVTRSASGSWRSKRVFAGRSPTGTALTVLNKVDGFLNAFLAGAQNVADGILRVISFLEQRVREIQELIRRIETYLDIPFNLSFPSAKVLLLVTNGTSGIITGLTSATNKPTEGSKAYAGGGVFVAGSAPSILVDLLASGIRSASQ